MRADTVDDRRCKQELARAMRRLARTPRTEAEVRENLGQKGLPENRLEEIVAELLRLGYIDDRSFAAAFARGRCERGHGRARIRREMAERGFAGAAIEAAVAGLDRDFGELNVLRSALAKRLRTRSEPKTPQELKNLIDHLILRGFSPETIRSELRDFFKRILGKPG